MSIYEAELRRRLMSGEVEEAARWFLRVCVADELEWKDLSPLEVRFFNDIRKSYQEWLKRHPLN